MKTVVLWPVYAVAMHRYGSRQLVIDSGYILKREPENPYHSNAVKVTTPAGGATKGYLRRQDADKLAPLLSQINPESRILLKPKYPVEIRSQRPGPQQLCKIGFKIKDDYIDKTESLLKCTTIPFEIKWYE